MTCDIRRSDKGPYYEMKIDGIFVGNYDTPTEAAKEFDKIMEEKREEVPA